MPNINFRPTVFPEKEIIAACSKCGKEVARKPWTSYGEYNRQIKSIEKEIKTCKHCKAKFQASNLQAIAWSKNGNRYSAQVKNGIFFVFKWDKIWRWSFKYFTEETPRAENTGVAFSVEVAKRICERHKEWH